MIIFCSGLSFGQGKWTSYDKKDGLAFTWIREYLWSQIQNIGGEIWIGAASTWKSGGVSVYDGNTWNNPDLPKLWANDFFEDSKGNMWILTFGRGVFTCNYSMIFLD